jgi:uncharacterized small protein (DUF1192 family)
MPGIVVGEDLARLSEGELRTRIEALRAEIERVEAALAAKEASRRAAASFFRT